MIREIREGLRKGSAAEEVFFNLALEDITRAADLFRPIHERTNGMDGWASIEVSPLVAHDTASTIAAAKDLYERAKRPNVFIKIPGTTEGLPAIEEAIFAGIPVNVTLLFSHRQELPGLRGKPNVRSRKTGRFTGELTIGNRARKPGANSAATRQSCHAWFN